MIEQAGGEYNAMTLSTSLMLGYHGINFISRLWGRNVAIPIIAPVEK
jgi:hypothetical protein